MAYGRPRKSWDYARAGKDYGTGGGFRFGLDDDLDLDNIDIGGPLGSENPIGADSGTPISVKGGSGSYTKDISKVASQFSKSGVPENSAGAKSQQADFAKAEMRKAFLSASSQPAGAERESEKLTSAVYDDDPPEREPPRDRYADAISEIDRQQMERNRMRTRVMRGLTAAALHYSGNEQAASQMVRMWADQQDSLDQRRAQIMMQRGEEGYRDDVREDEQAHDREQQDRNFGHDDAQLKQNLAFREQDREDEQRFNEERDRRNQDYETAQLQTKMEHELNINSRDHDQRLRELATSHGFGQQDIQARAKLESHQRRTEFWTQELGIDPASAEHASQALERGQLDDSARQTLSRVQDGQGAMIRMRRAQQELEALRAAPNVPVGDGRGGIKLARDGRPLTVPPRLDDVREGRTPEYVQDGRVIRRQEEAPPQTMTQQQQAPTPPDLQQSAEMVARAEGDAEALFGAHQGNLDSAFAAVAAEQGTSAAEKAIVLRKLRELAAQARQR